MAEAGNLALAGLLHDIGKFSQRVDNEQRWRHDAFTESFLNAFRDKLGEKADEIIKLAATHHSQVTDYEGACVKVADLLSSAERQRRFPIQISPEKAAFIALPSQVQLESEPPSPSYFALKPLALDEGVFFRQGKRKLNLAITRELGMSLPRLCAICLQTFRFWFGKLCFKFTLTPSHQQPLGKKSQKSEMVGKDTCPIRDICPIGAIPKPQRFPERSLANAATCPLATRKSQSNPLQGCADFSAKTGFSPLPQNSRLSPLHPWKRT